MLSPSSLSYTHTLFSMCRALRISRKEQDWTRALYFCPDGILIHGSPRSRTLPVPHRRHWSPSASLSSREIRSWNSKREHHENYCEKFKRGIDRKRGTEYLLNAVILNRFLNMRYRSTFNNAEVNFVRHFTLEILKKKNGIRIRKAKWNLYLHLYVAKYFSF